jgi:hypothetical protein
VDEMKTIEARIEAGMAWLDEQYPGWVEHVNEWTLDMADGNLCVLSQLSRSPLAAERATRFRVAARLDGLPGYTVMCDMHGFDLDRPADLGFTVYVDLNGVRVGDIFNTFPDLTRAWVLAIHARKGQLAAAGL